MPRIFHSHTQTFSATAAANTLVIATMPAQNVTPGLVWAICSFSVAAPAVDTEIEILVNGIVVHTLQPDWIGQGNVFRIDPWGSIRGRNDQTMSVRLAAGGGTAVGHVIAQFTNG